MKPSLLIVLSILTTASMHAQEQGRGKLTLKDCIRIAIENSFDLQDSYAASRAAGAGLTQAFGAYLPSADITANYNRQLTNLKEQFSIVNGVPIVGQPLPNTYGLTGNLNLTLFNGFRREAQYDAAQANVDATTEDVRFNRLSTAFDVTRKYIDVLRKQQLLNARLENLALSQATFDRVKTLKDNGRSTIQQVMSQETELANQEVSVVTAQNDRDVAKAQLLNAMSVSPSQLIEIDETSIAGEATANTVEEFRRKVGPESISIQRAFETRPDLNANRKRVSAAESGITSATATYWPTLSANAGYNWRNFSVGGFDTQGQVYIGLLIRIPVFDQFVTNLNIQNAELQHTRQSMTLARLENQIRTNIRSAYLQLSAAEKGLEITDRAMKSATINFNAVQERFNVGSATLLDVQTANNQLITARVNHVTAVYAYHDAATYVEFTVGTYGDQ
ncbi:MAG: TolC family protein [Candidatus Kapabacteria bacterium]|nr:TolC family protein [Candidatus Kapabacteria bacterium]